MELGLEAELPYRAIIPSSFAITDLASFVVIVDTASNIVIGPCQAAGKLRIQVTITAWDSLGCSSFVVAEKDPLCRWSW